MEKEKRYIIINGFIKENSIIIKNKEKVYYNTQMAAIMMAVGRRINTMERVNSYVKMEP